MDAQQLSGVIVETYRDFYEEMGCPANPGLSQLLTISAIQLGTTTSDLATAISDVAQALMDDLDNPATVDAITAARDQAQNLSPLVTCNIYTDLFDWLEWLQLQPGLDQATMDAIGTLLVLKDTIILSEYHGEDRPGAQGLSIVFFKTPNPGCSNFDADYLDGTSPIAFVQDRFWNEFLSDYYTSAGLL